MMFNCTTDGQHGSGCPRELAVEVPTLVVRAQKVRSTAKL